jgi:AraC family transcriptional activator of pyochelin receptor
VRQQLPDAVGDCHAERLQIDRGLAVVRSRYLPLRDLAEHSAQQDGTRRLILTFALQGDSGYEAHGGERLAFSAGFTTVSAARDSVGERRYRAGEAVTQLRLLVDEDTVLRYFGEEGRRRLLPDTGLRELAFGRTCAASAVHAAALGRRTAREAPSPLDLHIHALTLLANEMRALQAPAPAPASTAFSPQDIRKLEQARDLMQAQMQSPLTVAYLCASVGLGESKLQRGCQELFGASPYRLLLELRMRRALALLEAGSQVAQAAWQVGYAHPANFSAAFTRFHGRTPKTVRGRKT